MDIADHVRLAFSDFAANERESALLHALQALDGTAGLLRPGATTRHRMVQTIDAYLWVIEPMVSMGANLETTTFDWVPLAKRSSRFSEVLYEVFRTPLAHGAPFPSGTGVAVSIAPHHRTWSISAEGAITLPDTIVWALLAAVIFARCNANQRAGVDLSINYTSPAGTHDRYFMVDEWWGREDEVRDYFAEVLTQMTRVTMHF